MVRIQGVPGTFQTTVWEHIRMRPCQTGVWDHTKLVSGTVVSGLAPVHSISTCIATFIPRQKSPFFSRIYLLTISNMLRLSELN